MLRSTRLFPLLFLLASAARAGSDSRVVVELPKDALPETLGMSRDGAHVGYAVDADGRRRVFVDGRRLSPDRDKVGRVYFDPEGRYAYAAVDGTRCYMVRRNHIWGPYEDVQTMPAFSATGGHFAFRFKRDGKWHWAMDGNEESFETPANGALAFSADGQHAAYVAVRGGRAFMVVDGKAQDEYEEVGAPQYSPDGRLFYAERDKGLWRPVAAGKPGRPFDPPPRLVWFSESGRYAFVAHALERDHVVYEGVDLGPHDEIEPALKWSDEHLAFAARDGSVWRIFVDGQPGEPQPGPVLDFQLGPGGRPACIVISQGDKKAVSPHGMLGASYDGVGPPRLSADGQHCAYAAKSGKRAFVVVDNKEGPAFDAVDTPSFSSDTAHVAYAGTRDGRRFVVVDDKTYGPFESAQLIAPKPDEKGLSYFALDDGRWSRRTAVP